MDDETLKRRAEIVEALYSRSRRFVPSWKCADLTFLADIGVLTLDWILSASATDTVDRAVRAAAESLVDGPPEWSPHITLADCAAWAEAIAVAHEACESTSAVRTEFPAQQRLTAGEWDELGRLAKEPQRTFGKGRARIQTRLVRSRGGMTRRTASGARSRTRGGRGWSRDAKEAGHARVSQARRHCLHYTVRESAHAHDESCVRYDHAAIH